jgi:hypothetical protein
MLIDVYCPPWVRSGHVQRKKDVRFTPTSGHSGSVGWVIYTLNASTKKARCPALACSKISLG